MARTEFDDNKLDDNKLTQVGLESSEMFLNPLSPDSAIWYKMQLHAQYSVNLHEICTTKRSWKDLHFEGIISGPPPIQDLI